MLQKILPTLTHVLLAQGDATSHQNAPFSLTPAVQTWLAACIAIMIGAGVLIERAAKAWTVWRDSMRADRIADASLDGTWLREYEILEREYKDHVQESQAKITWLEKRLEKTEDRNRELERQKDNLALRLNNAGVGLGSATAWAAQNPPEEPSTRQPPAPAP